MSWLYQGEHYCMCTMGSYGEMFDSCCCSCRNKLSLLDMVRSFPPLSGTVARTYFELLLLTEVILQLQRPINVVTFFPTWLRSSLKKGAYKVCGEEMVAHSGVYLSVYKNIQCMALVQMCVSVCMCVDLIITCVCVCAQCTSLVCFRVLGRNMCQLNFSKRGEK